MSITQRIEELGLILPTVKAPAANYANAVRIDNHIKVGDPFEPQS